MKYLLYILLVIDLCFAKTVTISGSIFNNEGKPSRKAEVTLLAIDGSPITMMKTSRRGHAGTYQPNCNFLYSSIGTSKSGEGIH